MDRMLQARLGERESMEAKEEVVEGSRLGSSGSRRVTVSVGPLSANLEAHVVCSKRRMGINFIVGSFVVFWRRGSWECFEGVAL